MNRTTTLYETADLRIRRFDHPPGESHEDPDEEVGVAHAIAFVRTGGFRVEVQGRWHSLAAGGVFITRPGLPFRCRHAERCPDDVCLTVHFAPAAIGVHEHAWMRAGWAARPEPTPRLAYAQRRLAGAVDAGDRFEMERWALASLTALDMDARAAGARGPYAVRGEDLDLVVAAGRAIERDPTARRSVAERARALGVTSTRLTHAFRRYLGVSPHKYVVRWRLAAAAALLDEGASVSDGCWRSGFENLSHFCRVFRRTLGVRASDWRAVPIAERRRKVQDLLRAAS